MDRKALIDAKGPRQAFAGRRLDIAKVAARHGARVRERALSPVALDRRVERIKLLRTARRPG
jgi:hypothetical protein